ncbi:MAG: tetratricopeptide repeat protein [Novosphingobium sp.]|nr:tetratricopeptide repeat protein [Novosphingobium sp.]
MRSLAAASLLLAAVVPAQADTGPVSRALAGARAALVEGDGIAAQARLREAQSAGAKDDDVRALMGEALLAQGDLAKAREWLAPARFSPSTRALGFRMLGRLELRARRLPNAGRSFDQALAEVPRDAGLWTDIARLRYTGGEQAQAIQAADRALVFGPASAEALAFRALLIRNQNGLAASLPWFDAALRQAPRDASIRADKAATLADLGHYAAALTEIRAVQKANPGDPRSLYLQAAIAARGGRQALARKILQRGKGKLHDVPGVMLLTAALELDAGNANVAVELSDRLLRYQPDNLLAQHILARAMARSGEPRLVIARFGSLARRTNATPYMLTVVGRAYEELGRRSEATDLLQRAAAPPASSLRPLPAGADLPVLASRYPDAPRQANEAVPYIRALLALGDTATAKATARKLLSGNLGAPDAYLIAGDAEMARNLPAAALPHYQTAAAIRFGESELLRLDRSLRALGRGRDADLLAFAFAVENPQNLAAARMLANIRARGAQWDQSAALLEWIGARSGWRDPGLVADLAFARLRQQRTDEARRLALRAAKLQPSNPSVGQIMRLTSATAR